MKQLSYSNGFYKTENKLISLFTRTFPSFVFYSKFLKILIKSSSKAKRGLYDDIKWSNSSYDILRALESVGVKIEISGIENIEKLKKPCIFIGNHMSLLETVVLPIIIEPLKNVTFIVKQMLLDYPVFKHIMRSRDPIAVSRTNPRQDLKNVFEGGAQRLNKGISIIVFPQTTRTHEFDPKQFGSIGVKLAQKANVPIIPIALSTTAWGNGKRLKDFGRIDPSQKVHFAFGEPMHIQNRGNEEHKAIIEFISNKLKEWKG